jgi:hypothetical protein
MLHVYARIRVVVYIIKHILGFILGKCITPLLFLFIHANLSTVLILILRSIISENGNVLKISHVSTYFYAASRSGMDDHLRCHRCLYSGHKLLSVLLLLARLWFFSFVRNVNLN